jgi:hypothetical protein
MCELSTSEASYLRNPHSDGTGFAMDKSTETVQDLRNCHKEWCGIAAPCAKQLGDKHGNIWTF